MELWYKNYMSHITNKRHAYLAVRPSIFFSGYLNTHLLMVQWHFQRHCNKPTPKPVFTIFTAALLHWYWTVGLKRYAQPTIRYDTRYGAHHTICSSIHLPFLAGKQRLVITACDQKHRTQPTTAACAVMMRSGYNNGGLRVSRCSVFLMNLLVLLEYTGCYLWYLVFVSNFAMCYNCTVSYRTQSVSRYVP